MCCSCFVATMRPRGLTGLKRITGSRRRNASHSGGAPCIATMRNASPSYNRRLPNFASQMRVAFSSTELKTGSSSPGELEMAWRTSDVAVCRSSASESSRVRCCSASNSRTFSIAITAWSAKVSTSSICFSVNGRTVDRVTTRTPIGTPSRSRGTPSKVRFAPILRTGESYSGSAQYIRNVNRLAFQQRPTCDCVAARSNREPLERLFMLGRERERRGNPIDVSARPPDIGTFGFAQPCRRFNQRIEHRLQIECRAADDLEHVGGGGLLLQRLAQLVEQAGIFDGDDGLRGKAFDQIDLLFGERADFLAIDGDRADQLILLDHRGDKECAGTGEVDESNNQRIAFAVRRHRPKVVDVHDLPGPENLSMAAPWRGTE